MPENKDNFNINGDKKTQESFKNFFLECLKEKKAKEILSLVQQGIDPNLREKYGDTALFVLIEARDIKGVQLLLEKGAAVQVINGLGETPLMRACQTGSLEMVQLLIDESYIDSRAVFGETVLMKATRYNQLGILNILLNKKPNLEAKNKNGMTALAIAIEEGHFLAAQKLLKAGADANLDVLGRKTLLIMATQKFDMKLAKLLLENGADINKASKSTGETPLMRAVCVKNIEMIEFLLLHGANPMLQNKKKETVFKLAQGDEKILTLLKQYNELKKNRYLRGRKISSDFLKAVEINDIQAMYNLLILGGIMQENQELKNNNLVKMADAGDLLAVKKLLEEGINVDLPTLSGDTALMRASQNGDEKMAELLIQQGADVNFQNQEGKTALMSAVQFENLQMIKYLVLKGARLDLKNKEGQSALNMAVQSSNKGIFDLLVDIELIQKGLSNMDLQAVKISEQPVQKKDSFGRDYTF